MTTAEPHGRCHVGATGRDHNIQLIATWDDDATLADVEESIKVTARQAVHRARADLPRRRRA